MRKRLLSILVCLSLVFSNCAIAYSNEITTEEPTQAEQVEQTEQTTEEVVEDESEEESDESSEDVEELEESPEVEESEDSPEDIEEEPEEEPEEDTYEEPEEDLTEESEEDLSEEVEDTSEEVEEDINVASPSEIIDEVEGEDDSIPADMVEEPEEDEVIDEPEEPMLLGSVASPSDTEEVEEETEDEIEEATPSELAIDIPMLLGAPMFGSSGPASTWNELKTAIGNSSPGDVISLGANISVISTYTVANTVDITLDLNGHSIDGMGSQIFALEGKIKIIDSVGGGTITGAFSSSYGGAIDVKNGGVLILESGTFTGNNAVQGGGAIRIQNGGTFTMNGGKISGNTADYYGAGIYTSGTFEMNGGEISGNSTSLGGGICHSNGNIYLNSGKIINNTASDGGGIYENSTAGNKLYLGGDIIVKDNGSSSGDVGNIYLNYNNTNLEISSSNPLTSGANIWITVKYDNASQWGPTTRVDHHFNDTMTDDNCEYFTFTNCGSVEKNVAYGVSKYVSGGYTYYVTTTPPVCKIGTTGYTTLQEALGAVTSGQTIKLVQDISYTDGPDFIIDGKTVTIDFNGHSITVNTDTMIPTTNKLFTVTNSGNLTAINGEIKLIGNYSNMITSFTVSGTNSVLTLKNMQQSANPDRLLVNNGGKVYIDGGVFGYGATDNVKLTVTNGGTLNIKGGASFKFQTELIKMGESSNSNPDADMGTVVIDSATFEQGGGDAKMIRLYGKANVTLNGGVWTGNGSYSSLINIDNYGYKSNVTINNFNSDSPYVFLSASNPNIESFTATINNGHFKYTKGKFAIDRSNSLKPNIKLNGGFYGPQDGGSPVADDDALNELTALCASNKKVNTLSSGAEYTNGYRYQVVNKSSPVPIPPYNPGGGSSGGGGGGGSPKIDSNGNILGPSGKLNYDVAETPILTDDIIVLNWNNNTKNAQATDIHYVQNTDSFVRGDNSPVVTDWVGVATGNNSKLAWYRTNEKGQILRNVFIQHGNNIYYLDNNGVMVTGQYTINGVAYNFDTTVGVNEGRLLY